MVEFLIVAIGVLVIGYMVAIAIWAVATTVAELDGIAHELELWRKSFDD